MTARYRVERSLGLEAGFGPFWLTISPNGSGCLHTAWDSAIKCAYAQALKTREIAA